MSSWHERLPWAAVFVYLAGLLVFRVGGSAYDRESIAATCCLYLLQVLLLGLAIRWPRNGWWTLGVQVLLSFGPTVITHGDWLASGEFILAAAVLLSVRSKARWILFALTCVGAGVIRHVFSGPLAYNQPTEVAVQYAFATADSGLVAFGLLHLAHLLRRLGAARSELAGLALERDRLAMADQLRTTLIDRLSLIADGLERTLRLYGHAPDAARRQIMAVSGVARRTLADARNLAQIHPAPTSPEPGAARPASRLAWFLLGSALVFNAVIDTTLAPRHRVLVGGLSAVLAALQLAWLRRPGRSRVIVLIVVLLIGALAPLLRPTVHFPDPLCAAFGIALAVSGRRWLWSLVPVLLAWAAYLSAPPGLAMVTDPAFRIEDVVGCSLDIVVLYGLARLVQVSGQLQDAQTQYIRMAVLTDRLRIYRDVHDYLGLGLSAVALKADLIHELIVRDPARAGTETAAALRLTQRAEAEAGTVIGLGPGLSFEDEIAAARDVLAAAGIEVELHLPAMPVWASSTLVPVLREAVTNILRHSDARHVTVSATVDAEHVRLHITNDGAAQAPRHRHAHPGNGLINLSNRTTAAGGTLTATTTTDSFNLIAEIPRHPAAVAA